MMHITKDDERWVAEEKLCNDSLSLLEIIIFISYIMIFAVIYCGYRIIIFISYIIKNRGLRKQKNETRRHHE